MKIFIVIHTAWNTVESVWDKKELAQQALLVHATGTGQDKRYYQIIERRLNELKPEDIDANNG